MRRLRPWQRKVINRAAAPMPLWARMVLIVLIALIIAIAVIWPRPQCPPGQDWVLSDGKWLCLTR